MDIPSPESRRLKISTGPLSSSKLQYLAASHPFTQQLDIVFPSSDATETALCALETRYGKGKVKISDVVEEAGAFVSRSALESNLTMLSLTSDEGDVWCIDPRGLMTISASKETYERLGLVGKKLPFKGYTEIHAIHLPLQQHAESVTNRARRNAALKGWDARREGPWDVLYQYKALAPTFTAEHQIQEVKCQMKKSTDIHVPIPRLTPHPSSTKKNKSDTDEDAEEDWNADMAALFEWVGMACLGAQRLRVNDRVEPYVAVYEPPLPSRTGDITHLHWEGFLGPEFVQQVINTAIACATISNDASADSASRFLSITSHAFPVSPVSYISPSTFAPDSGSATRLDTPMRVPRATGEDTWSLVVTPGPEGSTQWVMAESVGQWDARWG